MAVAVSILMASLSGCTGVDTTEKYELVVALEDEVTAAERDAVEQRMRAVAKVESVTVETGAQAFEAIKEDFKDRPDLWQDMTPEDFGGSLTATVTDASIAEAVEIMMNTVEGVEYTAIRATADAAKQDSIGVILQLSSVATDDQRAAAEQAVHAFPQADSIEYESKEGAVERLRQRCEGRPDLLGVLDATRTYASVRFEIGLEEKSPGIFDLQKLGGVERMRFVPVSVL